MQEAALKFRKYASKVERDIEVLVFEMLDLIDSKTRTLRKLMKLHLNVRRVTRITNDPTITHAEKIRTVKRKSSSSLITSICDSITENISLTESTRYHTSGPIVDSMLEVSDFEKRPKNKDASYTNDVEKTIEDIGKGIEDIQLVEDTNNTTNETDGNIVEGSANAVSEEAVAPSGTATPENQHPNSPSNFVEGPCHGSSQSSVHSYSIIINLEGALNNLEECQPGGQGVYLDTSTYRNVVSSLKTAIANYGLICATANTDFQGSGTRLLGMGRSSTQPVLNVNVEDKARRKTCSSTGWDKLDTRRKRC